MYWWSTGLGCLCLSSMVVIGERVYHWHCSHHCHYWQWWFFICLLSYVEMILELRQELRQSWGLGFSKCWARPKSAVRPTSVHHWSPSTNLQQWIILAQKEGVVPNFYDIASPQVHHFLHLTTWFVSIKPIQQQSLLFPPWSSTCLSSSLCSSSITFNKPYNVRCWVRK